MYKRFLRYIKENRMLEGTDHIIVGLSGGADSVCLLSLLKKCVDDETVAGNKPGLSAFHVHHGLRKASDDEEVFVKELCEKLGVPVESVHIDVNSYARENGLGTEEAARILRRKALSDEAERIRTKDTEGNVKIALAHHKDDQAETVLFNLFRGSEIKGLAGIRPCRDDIIRPLLFADKAEILEYINSEGLEYVTDESNADISYSRNRIRHNIIPEVEKVYPSGKEHIVKTAERIALISDYVDKETARVIKEYVIPTEDGERVKKGDLLSLHPFMQSAVIYEMISRCLGRKKDITHAHVVAVLELAKNDGGGTADLPYSVRGFSDQTYVGVKKEAGIDDHVACPDKTDITFTVKKRGELSDIPDSKYTKWIDNDKIDGQPEIRTRQPGDYIFFEDKEGNLHKKSLKEYFIEEKISRFERDSIPLIADGSHILWVVGYRISAAVKINEQTENVMILTKEGL